jgi:hypothetical protein
MSDARTSPPPQARYAVSAVCDLRGVAKVYGRGPAEVHAPRQATAPYAGAIVSSSLRVCNVKAKAERHWIRRAPTHRNGLRLMAPHCQQPSTFPAIALSVRQIRKRPC